MSDEVENVNGAEVPETPTEDQIKPDWPDDWRNKMAGDDEKTLKRLERFQSPADIFKSYRAMEQKVSSGEMKNALKEGASEEELAAWRKDNGIPEKPEGYFENLPEGMAIGEEDKPMFDAVAERIHGINADPKVMKELASWYYEHQEAQSAAQTEKDNEYLRNNDDALRAEWGNEYRGNVNTINAFLKTAFPEGVGDMISQARLPDGSVLGSNAEILKSFVTMARDLNPSITLVPAAGSNAGAAIDDEIKEIESLMGNHSSEYWKGPKSKGIQERYRKLLEFKEREAS